MTAARRAIQMNMTYLQEAERIAREAHQGQVQRDGSPYIDHVQAVVDGVAFTDEKIVAWLHDVLEDNPKWTAVRLAACGFSERQVAAVTRLTHKNERYEDYIVALADDPLARTVKLSDLAHNLLTKHKNRGRYLLAQAYLRSKE